MTIDCGSIWSRSTTLTGSPGRRRRLGAGTRWRFGGSAAGVVVLAATVAGVLVLAQPSGRVGVGQAGHPAGRGRARAGAVAAHDPAHGGHPDRESTGFARRPQRLVPVRGRVAAAGAALAPARDRAPGRRSGARAGKRRSVLQHDQKRAVSRAPDPERQAPVHPPPRRETGQLPPARKNAPRGLHQHDHVSRVKAIRDGSQTVSWAITWNGHVQQLQPLVMPLVPQMQDPAAQQPDASSLASRRSCTACSPQATPA